MKAFTVETTIKHTSVVYADTKDEAIEIHKMQHANNQTNEDEGKIKAIRNRNEENRIWKNAQDVQNEAIKAAKGFSFSHCHQVK